MERACVYYYYAFTSRRRKRGRRVCRRQTVTAVVVVGINRRNSPLRVRNVYESSSFYPRTRHSGDRFYVFARVRSQRRTARYAANYDTIYIQHFRKQSVPN